MEEIVHNHVTMEGMREVKLVSDREILEARMLGFVNGASRGLEIVKCYPTAALNLFYGEVSFPCREVIEFKLEKRLRVHHLVVWKLVPEEGYHVSEIIQFLAEWYFVRAHQKPQYAFMRKLPAGVENGQRLEIDGYELDLFEAEWALTGCLMIGG
jgi:hypothetical protein